MFWAVLLRCACAIVSLRDVVCYVDALKWYRKPAEAGHAQAQYNLGINCRDAAPFQYIGLITPANNRDLSFKNAKITS